MFCATMLSLVALGCGGSGYTYRAPVYQNSYAPAPYYSAPANSGQTFTQPPIVRPQPVVSQPQFTQPRPPVEQFTQPTFRPQTTFTQPSQPTFTQPSQPSFTIPNPGRSSGAIRLDPDGTARDANGQIVRSQSSSNFNFNRSFTGNSGRFSIPNPGRSSGAIQLSPNGVARDAQGNVVNRFGRR